MSPVKDKLALQMRGWIRDVPDFRDRIVSADTFRLPEPSALPEKVDLREYFPPADQSVDEFASPAFACGNLVEYYRRRFQGDVNQISKWFLFYAAQRYEGIQHCPPSLRATIKALVRAGAPPSKFEQMMPRTCEGDITEPILYSYQRDFQDIAYYRVASDDGDNVVQTVRQLLAAKTPCLFGFSVPSSTTGDFRIDYRPDFDSVIGSAVGIIIGYDDTVQMSSRGAMLFRSCWGPNWGEAGNGWISYRLMKAGMAGDFWTLTNCEWQSSME